MKQYVYYVFFVVALAFLTTASAAVMQVPEHAQDDKQVPRHIGGSAPLTEIEKQNDVLKRQTNIIKELFTRVMKLEEKVKRLEEKVGSSNE